MFFAVQTGATPAATTGARNRCVWRETATHTGVAPVISPTPDAATEPRAPVCKPLTALTDAPNLSISETISNSIRTRARRSYGFPGSERLVSASKSAINSPPDRSVAEPESTAERRRQQQLLQFESIPQPRRRGLFQKLNFALLRLKNQRVIGIDWGVVVDPQHVHFTHCPQKIGETRLVYSPQGSFGSAVTAGVCSRLHALNMHGKVPQRDVPHLDRKSGGSGESGLLECDIAAKGCFDGETLAVIDMVPDKRLKIAVHHLANFARNAEVRAAIQFRGPIIRVEKGDSEAGHWVQR